jgi:hypothetical protein
MGLMKKLFKSSTDSSSDWLMCSFGCSGLDNKDYHLTTNHLKGDEVPNEMMDAKESSEMAAGLLNAWYASVDCSKMSPEQIMAMGRIDPDEINDPNQTTLF